LHSPGAKHYGLHQYFDTGLPQQPYPRLRQCANKKTAAQQENGSGFFGFVAAYCGLRSSAIPVTSKEKRDGKKNQTNNVSLFI
jgi:hypothetical protein